MNQKELYQKLISEGMSTYKMAKSIGIGQTAMRYRLNKLGLKTLHAHPHTRPRTKLGDTKTCSQCSRKLIVNKQNFYIQRSGKIHAWCKKCNDRISYKKQRDRKEQAVMYKGGKCSVCGYNKCFSALDFHHIDPTKKDHNISKLKTYALEILKTELDKCVCICRNCHAELHHNEHLKKMVGPEGLEPPLRRL